MEKKTKKSVFIGTTLLLLVSLVLVGISYAYYRTRIIDNPNEQSISVTSKKLEVIYQDGDSNFATTNEEDNIIFPGHQFEKYFSVKNNSDETAYYAVIIENLNTTKDDILGDFYYELYDGLAETVISSGTLNSSLKYLTGKITIEPNPTDDPGKIDYYKLVVTYQNTSVNQNYDAGATLSFKVNIVGVENIFADASSGTLLSAISSNNVVEESRTIPGREVSSIGSYTNKVAANPYEVQFAVYNKYIVYGTGYELDQKTGLYTLTGVKTGKYDEIYEELEGAYLFSSSPDAYGFLFSSESDAQKAQKDSISNLNVIYEIVQADESNGTSATIFHRSIKAVPTTGLLAATEDDYGTSYYFRGAVGNNFVNFSGKCWRIVRVQGDEKIKLVLADKNKTCESMPMDGDNAFAGSAYYSSVLYDETEIPNILAQWISAENLDTSKMDTTEWCSDISYSSFREIYGENNIVPVYDSQLRIGDKSKANPSLKCDFVGEYADHFPKAVKYTANIAMLTADEVAFAGHVVYKNVETYLTDNLADWTSSYWWTMTPATQFNSSNYPTEIYPSMYLVRPNGAIFTNEDSQTTEHYIRPAIVLKKDVLITSGNGTKTNPYVIG